MSAVQSLIAAHRQGAPVGLYSVCCSNAQVLLAAMQVAQRYDTLLLIEAPIQKKHLQSLHLDTYKMKKSLLFLFCY